MLNQYNRKHLKQLNLYFRCLSSVCGEGLLGYYYLVYNFYKGERVWRKSPMKKALKYWNITDATSLKERIGWLLEDGFRKEYKDVHARLAALPQAARRQYVEASKEEPDYAELAVVHKMMNQLPTAEIAALGAGWAIYFCRIGQVYGYLSKEEAWALKIKAAELLQRSYAGWEDYLTGFTAGSHFMACDHEIKKFVDLRNFVVALSGYSRFMKKKPEWHIHLYPGNERNARQQEPVSV
ncbi:DUF1266 domain-containing protein [Paenibacillus sp. DMB20]|uniref:DUF1266 domain-containing protein n=1 Tax=Paenibacillus sp. DMB20 TaxID=1642570 RepID=UPI00069B4953|nr:DUF1266 domain-containing protein [Paenibacillus sp. DMB20]